MSNDTSEIFDPQTFILCTWRTMTLSLPKDTTDWPKLYPAELKLGKGKKKYTQDMSVRVFSLLMSLPLIFPLEETSSCWAAQRHTCHCFSDTHAHTFCNLLTHTNTNIHRNVQSLIPWSLICAPVSGREVEWQYGIPGGTERCGDRHPNPSPSRPPKHRKTRPKRK